MEWKKLVLILFCFLSFDVFGSSSDLVKKNILTTQKSIKESGGKNDISSKSGNDTKLEDVAEFIYPKEIGQDLGNNIVTLANRLDSFFGEERADNAKNGSTLKISPAYTFNKNSQGKFELGINLNLKLLNLEAKARALEEKIKKEYLDPAQENIQESIVGKEDSNSLGAQSNASSQEKTRMKTIMEEWHFNFESRLLSRPAIYYSGKFKGFRDIIGDLLVHHISFNFGWDTDNSWIQEATAYSDNAISSNLLFRFANEATWYISGDRFLTSHGPSLIHSINQYNSVSYNARIVYGTDYGSYSHEETVYNIDFRHGTPSKKIYIDLVPKIYYQQSTGFREEQSFMIQVEYIFGDRD